jgi:hypothetical protein
MMLMRRIAVTSILALVVTTLLPATAQADKPGAHLVGDVTTTLSTSGLTVSGKGAGFGGFVTEAFLAADEVHAMFQCRNTGGNVAPGQPSVMMHVVGEPQTITPREGQIAFSVTLPAPPPPHPADVCPNGNWTVDPVPLMLMFFGVELHFEQNGDEILVVELGDFGDHHHDEMMM